MWWRTTTTTSLKLKLIINLCIFPPAFHDALVVRPEWENGKFSKFQELPWCSLYDVLSTEEEQQQQQQLPVVTFQVLENVNTARPAGPAVSTSATVTSQTAYSQRHTHVNFGHNHTNMKLSNARQTPPYIQRQRPSIQNKFVGLLLLVPSCSNQ